MKEKHVKGLYWYIKRLLDIIFSFVLLIITSPIMLIVSICLLINLGRPIYNQRRYREGLNKKKFLMYKLRTNNEFRKEIIAQVYEMYQKKLRENNAIDFDDIINYTIKIWSLSLYDISEYHPNVSYNVCCKSTFLVSLILYAL